MPHPLFAPSLHILLVEDNPADADLVREAFASADTVRISVARTGEEALRLLAGPKPDLVLLDLQLPGMSGFDVLRAIKGERAMRQLPVLVLSGSRLSSDVATAYDGHANSYIPKPVGLANLREMVRIVQEYWMRHAKLPPRASA
ncbi:MAG TPA: response regulator [Candidatus Thermoplasmatota archaeon]|nr:response regulator [Candidatus Thermoplasmatota archaeon]